MDIIWTLDSGDVTRLRAFVDARRDEAFVRYRIDKNVEHPPTAVDIGTFWEVLVGALLTSQQRSGPDSYVSRFLRHRPFLLSYAFYQEQQDPESAGRRVLQDFGGLRFSTRVAKHLAYNHEALRGGLWSKTEAILEHLIMHRTPESERRASEFIREHFVGVGPKQSRNLLQGLGLTQYEIPIDSRITKWLNSFDFPLHLTANGLSDPGYYNFVSDGIQAMCAQSGVLPCVFDAAVFSSYDKGWTEDNVIW